MSVPIVSSLKQVFSRYLVLFQGMENIFFFFFFFLHSVVSDLGLHCLLIGLSVAMFRVITVTGYLVQFQEVENIFYLPEILSFVSLRIL